MSFRTTISWLLFPLTMWYAVGVWVRDVLYALGIIRQEAPHITTIGVGNLSVGGAGKTPHVEYLLDLLADSYPTAMLSRGYKRSSKGFLLDDGTHDPDALGDEPAMIARKHPNVQVAVCEKRVEGVRRLMSGMPDESDTSDKKPPQLVILDDVYQHRRIKPSINLLLTEYRHPFFSDHILPYGNLREFRSGRFRASIVIVTKSPAHLNPIEKHNIINELRLQNYQKIFFSYLKYGTIQTLDGIPTDLELRRLDQILVVTGIAHPEPLLEEVRRSCKAQHLRFADHHKYTPRDIDRISEAFHALRGQRKIILTTEKDAIRLHGLTKGLPVYVMPVKVAFHQDSNIVFDQVINASVRENISFLNKLSIWS